MEASDRRTVILLVVIAAVLALAFVVAIVYRPGAGLSADWRERWRARLFPASPVAPGQLAGCTAAPGPFTIAGSCQLRIAPASTRSRRLTLVAVDPVELLRTVDADGRALAMRAQLAAGETSQLYIGEAGEALALRCRSGLTCRARLDSPGGS